MLRRRKPGASESVRTRGTLTFPAAVDVLVEAVVVVVVETVVVVDGPVPVDTLSVTFEPLSTSLPAGGFWAPTVPAGRADGTLWSTGLRPAPVSAFTAEPCVWPTTCGTTTGFEPPRAGGLPALSGGPRPPANRGR